MGLKRFTSKTKSIGIFGRAKAKNIGDAVICDTCKYLVEQVAKEKNQKVNVTVYDALSSNKNKLKKGAKSSDIIVFPGGGINNPTFTKKCNEIADLNPKAKIFVNACGVSDSKKVSDRAKEEISNLFNRENIIQITTRGSFKAAKKYAQKKHKYPVEFVLDPAIFSAEAFGITRDEKSKLIGIGIIREDIFKRQKKKLGEEEVLDFYVDLIKDIEKHHYKWEFFCNGMVEDYEFAKLVLERLGKDEETHLALRPTTTIELVTIVSKYKGIIAARFHANIIATSLGVPSVAVVWNNKMLGLSQAIGAEDRYIVHKADTKASVYVDKLREAIKQGYNTEKINAMKETTKNTIANMFE